MMIGNVGKMQYNIMLERIKKQIQEGKKVKPIKSTDNNGELTDEKVPKKKNNESKDKQ